MRMRMGWILNKKWRENFIIILLFTFYARGSLVMSSSSGERWSISAGWVFRGTEYTVCADVRDDVLVVQVEDKVTADRWRGQFDAKREFRVCI